MALYFSHGFQRSVRNLCVERTVLNIFRLTRCFERHVLNMALLPQLRSLSQTMFRQCRSTNFSPGLTHREPLLDEPDFERFVQKIEPLMKAGRDVLWVLAGRMESNISQAEKGVGQVQDEQSSGVPLLRRDPNAAVRLLAEAAGPCEFEEPGASLLC